MRETVFRILVPVLLGLLFLSLFETVYRFFYLLRQHEVLKRAWEKSVKVLDQKNKNRKELEKKQEVLFGEMERKNLSAGLDRLFAYSGIYSRFPHLTAEKFTSVLAVGICMETVLVWLLSGRLFTALAAAAVTLTVILELLKLLRAVRRRKIEEESLHFLDLLEMNALTSQDVIQIFRKTAAKVSDPLKTELFNMVADAEHSGASAAVRKLAGRVENPYLKDLFLNLEICSRYKANYGEVISAAKKIFQQDAAAREKLRKLYQNQFGYIVVLLVIGAACLQGMCSGMTGGGNVFVILWQSGGAGRLIAEYLAAASALGLWRSGVRAFLG